MYTRTGERLLLDGVFNPGSGGKLPANLKFVFGMQSATTTEDFSIVETGQIHYYSAVTVVLYVVSYLATPLWDITSTDKLRNLNFLSTLPSSSSSDGDGDKL